LEEGDPEVWIDLEGLKKDFPYPGNCFGKLLHLTTVFLFYLGPIRIDQVIA
jgi:hypothetical protein